MSKLFLYLAILVTIHPALRASNRLQASAHSHAAIARKTSLSLRAAMPAHAALMQPLALEPAEINPPTHTTVITYLINLLRGIFRSAA